jgi:hypothetical protein
MILKGKINKVKKQAICCSARDNAGFDQFPKNYPRTYPQKMWTILMWILLCKKVTGVTDPHSLWSNSYTLLAFWPQRHGYRELWVKI